MHGNLRNTWEHNGKTQSFVIDYDHLTGINTIDDFIMVHVVRKMPLPYYISQTGPDCFHALYIGKQNEWPKEKRLWLLYKWAGIENPTTDTVELYNRFLESGIDTNYYGQHYGKHKIRVPGSINSNHVMPDGSFWKVVGWQNPAYDNADKQYYEEMAVPRPNYIPSPVVESITAAKPVDKRYNPDFFVEPILAVLNDMFPDGMACATNEALAKMLSSGAGWLMSSGYRILQTKWAAEWGCTQSDVSRLLKRLIDKGILTKVNDDFCKNRYAKTYGAGEVLRSIIGGSCKTLQQPSWVRWDDGTSNQRMLYDVRYMVSIGLDNLEIIRQLNERQAHRPKRKLRSSSDFLICINKTREWNKTHAGSGQDEREERSEWWL